MANSPISASSQSDGRWKIAFVPASVSNPLSVAAIKGASSKELTYDFTPGGFNFTASQVSITDARLTLPQNLNRPGKVTESGTLQYVDSADPNSAAVTLAPVNGSLNGPAGTFVVRKGTDNATDWAAGDKVDIYTAQTGIPLPDAPSENSVDTITQGVYLTKPTQRKQALVA